METDLSHPQKHPNVKGMLQGSYIALAVDALHDMLKTLTQWFLEGLDIILKLYF